MGASSPTVVDIVRTLSTENPPAGTGSVTGGLAQAILQERLQQQSQVGQPACLCALDLCNLAAVSMLAGRVNTLQLVGSDEKPRPHELPM